MASATRVEFLLTTEPCPFVRVASIMERMTILRRQLAVIRAGLLRREELGGAQVQVTPSSSSRGSLPPCRSFAFCWYSARASLCEPRPKWTKRPRNIFALASLVPQEGASFGSFKFTLLGGFARIVLGNGDASQQVHWAHGQPLQRLASFSTSQKVKPLSTGVSEKWN